LTTLNSITTLDGLLQKHIRLLRSLLHSSAPPLFAIDMVDHKYSVMESNSSPMQYGGKWTLLGKDLGHGVDHLLYLVRENAHMAVSLRDPQLGTLHQLLSFLSHRSRPVCV